MEKSGSSRFLCLLWQRIAVRVKKGKAWVFWNGRELGGGPFDVDRIKRVFAGIYTNYVGGLGEATTKVDSFLLKEE